MLRYLPTNLTAPEIAGELYVSRNTVKAHTRHLYAKLGAHRRAEAVDRLDLGLLAPPHVRRGPVPGLEPVGGGQGQRAVDAGALSTRGFPAGGVTRHHAIGVVLAPAAIHLAAPGPATTAAARDPAGLSTCPDRVNRPLVR